MVMRLYCDTNICITTQEYEVMVHELQVKEMTGTLTTGDRILATVLNYMNYRYCEIIAKRQAAAAEE
jgi:hypothetical protein